MKKLTVKTITGLFLATGVVTAGVYGISKIDNKELSYEVNSKEAIKYNQNNIAESNNSLENDSKTTKIENDVKTKEEKVATAVQEYEKAVEAKKACEEELKNVTNAEDKAKVEAKLKVLEEKVKKTETVKKEAEKTLEEVKSVEEPKTEVKENNNKTSNNTTTIESPSQNTNDLETVQTAVEKTINANNMTVNNNVENSTRKFDKTTGNEYAEYRKSFSITEKAGTLYSYKINSTKTVSLFKESGTNEWKMVFSGKRSLGVIELELLKNIKSVEKNNDIYNVTISSKNASTWYSTYYGKYPISDDITLAAKINNGYVQSIKGNIANITIDLTLSNINSTNIPSRNSIGIDDNTIEALEAEYQAKKDCERENDYWVCGPHKHVNQYHF